MAMNHELNQLSNGEGDGGERQRASLPPTRAPVRSRSASTRSAWSRRKRTVATIANFCSAPAEGMQQHFRRDSLRRNHSAESKGRHAAGESDRAGGCSSGYQGGQGAQSRCPSATDETITEGLDGLRERAGGILGLGARFAKWRADTDTKAASDPTIASTRMGRRWRAMPRLCQEKDIVPIVEPEVLMDFDNDIEACDAVTEWVLKETFAQLYYANVALEGMVLKPNMVISGMKAQSARVLEEVAESTVKVLKRCVPSAVPGITFLSGGQSDEQATAHLKPHECCACRPLPWAHLLLRPCSAGRAAEGMERQGGKCRGRATRVRPSRPHERPRSRWPMERRPGEDKRRELPPLSHYSAAARAAGISRRRKSARWMRATSLPCNCGSRGRGTASR